MAIWKVKTKEGKEVSELNTKWADVKDSISEFVMITNDNRTITLPKNMEKYTQFKTASSDIGGNKIDIESRTIGFSLGNKTVTIRVNEKNNNISIDLIEAN